MFAGTGLTITVPYVCDAPASAAAPANPVSMLFFLMRVFYQFPEKAVNKINTV